MKQRVLEYMEKMKSQLPTVEIPRPSEIVGLKVPSHAVVKNFPELSGNAEVPVRYFLSGNKERHDHCTIISITLFMSKH